MKNHAFAWYRFSGLTCILDVQFVAHSGLMETTYNAVIRVVGIWSTKKVKRFIYSVKLDEAQREMLSRKGY
jgi:hypothetical protein